MKEKSRSMLVHNVLLKLRMLDSIGCIDRRMVKEKKLYWDVWISNFIVN